MSFLRSPRTFPTPRFPRDSAIIRRSRLIATAVCRSPIAFVSGGGGSNFRARWFPRAAQMLEISTQDKWQLQTGGHSLDRMPPPRVGPVVGR